MGFFDAEKQSWQDQRVEDWSVKLRDALKKHGRIQSPPSMKAWGKDFATLRKTQAPEVIDAVLDWFLNHLTDPYVPVVCSAKTFRMKFVSIKIAMDRTLPPKAETIELDYIRLAERMANELTFPVEIGAKLPHIIQRTDREWENFKKELKLALTLAATPMRSKNFISLILQYRSPTFTEDWIGAISDKFGRLRSFSGMALGLSFKPESLMFKETFWQRWAFEWSGGSNQFDDCLSVIIKRKEWNFSHGTQN